MNRPASVSSATATTENSMIVNASYPRRVLGLSFLAAVLVAFAVVAVGAPAASADVQWNSEVLQAPTNLPPSAAPGGEGIIRIIGSNKGDTASSTFPTVSFELPEGVTINNPAPDDGHLWTCTGSPTVTCTNMFGDFFSVPPYSYVGLIEFGGDMFSINLPVDVAADAPEGSHAFDVTMSGGGGADATQTHEIRIDDQQLPFGITPGTFEAGAFDQADTDYTQAGGHPYQATTSFDLNTRFYDPTTPGVTYSKALLSEGNPKDVVVDLPAGFVGDPSVGPKCPDLGAVAARSCPASSQIGVATVSAPLQSNGRRRMFAIYNVVPNDDVPALFAFYSPVGTVLLKPVLRSDGDMGLSVHVRNITQADTVMSTSATVWGVPADSSHDSQRCANPNFVAQTCVGTDEGHLTEFDNRVLEPQPAGAPRRSFLTNPTECSGSPVTTLLHMSSWEAPGPFEADGDPDLADGNWMNDQAQAPAVTGCDQLQFNPEIKVRPTNTAPGAPTGLDFELAVPQNADPDGLATAHLKDTTFTLPDGMKVNPASADGLAACTSTQIGLTSKSPVRFTKLEPSCPNGAKIGTVEVDTPLLEEPLTGDVLLAKQGDNPFDSLLAVYIVVRGPGLLVKIAGHVEADAQTGQLKTTVLSNPQVPFDTLKVHLKGGARATLTTPETCGTHTAVAELTSWAGNVASVGDSFSIDCPGNANAFDPGFSAGATSLLAGSYSPFVARVTRENGKELGRINLTMPKGLLANLKPVEVCSDAQIASSSGKQGVVTRATPSCPLDSQIGTTTVGAGSGPTPFFPTLPGSNVTGRVFLAAPHRNIDLQPAGIPQADYGLAIEVPAVAGPFDIGTVMVRAAIFVDPATAQIRVISDRLPRILQGIVLDVRDVRVNIDRKGFTTTPTSCQALQIGADIRAQDGTQALRSSRFQVGECAALRFKPRLALSLTGREQTTTGKHPGVRATVRQTGLGEAGIKRAEVRLPKSLALDPDNAQALCEFEDGTKPDLENRCPKGSIVGRATAFSPLLKRRLSGNVYFVKNVRIDKRTGNRIRTLPMIVAALRGEVDINLRGKSSVSGSKLVNTFNSVPDAPISRFNLNIAGGGNGILAVTRTTAGKINICSGKQVAQALMNGQNGMRRNFDVRMKAPCATKRKARK